MDRIPSELILLGLDSIAATIFYKLYWNSSTSARELKNAPELTIDEELAKTVAEAPSSTIPYAAVQGKVVPLQKSLYCLKNEGKRHEGVIQRYRLIEHTIEWSKYSKFWSEKEKVLRNIMKTVTFGLFNGKHSVEVDEPLEAYDVESELTTVYQHFEPAQSSLSKNVVDWMYGERTKGIEETESMLLNGTKLTAFGQLVVSEGDVHVQPPTNGAKYILTSLSRSELLRKFETKSRIYKILTFVFGVVGISIFVIFAERMYRRWQIKREARRNRQRLEEERRQQASLSNDRQSRFDSTAQVCVVCLANPREVVILECGHICLCYDCVERLTSMHCPVCRANISRIVPTFLS